MSDPTIFVTPNYVEPLQDEGNPDMTRCHYEHMLIEDECACSYFEPGTIVSVTRYPWTGNQPITLKVAKHIQHTGDVHLIEFSESVANRLCLDLTNDIVWVTRAS